MIEQTTSVAECAVDFRIHRSCDLSVVIPAYCSEQTLGLLIERLVNTLDLLDLSYEIVLVDDGSPDATWATIEGLRRRFPDRIAAIQLMRNFGQHNALMCGFRHSQGQLIVTMDDDLQNPPEEISRLIAEIERTDFDLIYGRYSQKQHASFRNLGSSIVNAFYRYAFQTDVTVTSFRVIRRRLLDSILSHQRQDLFLDGLLAWNTRRIGSVLVEHCPRQQGRSNYSLVKLASLAMNLFTGFSLLPLRMILLLGIAISIGSVGMGGFYIARWCLNGSTVGSVEVITTMIVAAVGIQLFSLGIVGEYLGRVLRNLNGKHQYIERQSVDRSFARMERARPHSFRDAV